MKDNIGNFIKKLRKENNMTQDELANLIPTDRSNISRWERSNVSIPLNQMERICEIFNIQISELLIGEKIDNKNLNESNKKIINNIKENNKKYKKILIVMVSSLVLLVITLITFFSYYFFQTFNTEKIYKVYIDSDQYELTSGLLVITREEVYFKLGSINEKDMQITLYKNDELRFSGGSNSLLIDFYGYDQYFDTKTLKNDLDKYYIEIENNRFKLNFDRIYSNKNLIQEANDRISKETNNEKQTELYIPLKIKELFKCDEEKCEYKENNIQYIYYPQSYSFIIMDNEKTIIFDNFVSNSFEAIIDEKNYNIYNGNIECNDDCDFKKKIYDKYFKKVKEKFWN